MKVFAERFAFFIYTFKEIGLNRNFLQKSRPEIQ